MRKIIVAAAAIAALGAGASSASAEQSVSISDAGSVVEGSNGAGGQATFTITYQRSFNEPRLLNYSTTTAPGSAAQDDDYLPYDSDSGDSPGPLCADQNGCTVRETVTVPIVGDNTDEPDETFFVHLSSSLPVKRASAQATIVDDDASPEAPGPSPGGTTTAGPNPSAATAPALIAQPQQGGGSTAPAAAGQAADEVGPRMGMAFRGLRKRAVVRVSCPEDERSCAGRLRVRLNEQTLGAASYRMRGGESRLLAVRLTRAERRMLRRAGVIYLKTTAFDAAGNRLVRELSFQLS